MVNKWITDNYDDLKRTTYNILGEDNYHEVDDLLHECITMFLQNKNAQGVVERGEAKWFFIRILLNQHRSKTSHYHKTYRRNKSFEYIDEIDVESHVDLDEYDYDLDQIISTNLTIVEKMLTGDNEKERYLAFIMMMYFSNDYNFAEVARRLDVSRTTIRRQFDEGAKIVISRLDKIDTNLNYNKLPLKILTTELLKNYGKGRRF